MPYSTTNATSGYGTLLQVNATTVAEVVDISVNIGADMLDATNMESASMHREFIAGPRQGTVQIEGNFTSADYEAAFLEACLDGTVFQDSDGNELSIVAGATTITFTQAYVESCEIKCPVDGKRTVSITIRGSGEIGVTTTA